MTALLSYTAFVGHRRLETGDAASVASAARGAQRDGANVVIFDDATGRQVEVDPFSQPPAIAGASATDDPPPVARGRGRPKLGVVPREVTLLPRHWDWLSAQPGGASAALRRLVEDARRASTDLDRSRQVQQSIYAAMSTLAGDLPGFEEASRALFAGDQLLFAALVSAWPADIAAYLLRLGDPGRQP